MAKRIRNIRTALARTLSFPTIFWPGGLRRDWEFFRDALRDLEDE